MSVVSEKPISRTLELARPLAYYVLAIIEKRDENYAESITNFENAAFYS